MKKNSSAYPWQKQLEQQLPLLGHRNWIVIADSAYPWQNASGIETLVTGTDQLEAVRVVLGAVEQSNHVRSILYTDAELPFLSEKDAPGITKYRENLGKILERRKVQSLPHERIIGMLDEAGKAFRILILKTRLILPYTSIFIQLDCGYWSDAAEQRLREKLPK